MSNNEQEVLPIVIDLDQDPRNAVIIQVRTGLSNTVPEYQFGPNESIELSVQDPVCCCGVPRAPFLQENPLVAAGIVSPDLAQVFAPPDEKIPAGRKRALRVQSKARMMSGDEVYQDIKCQQDLLEEKQRQQADKKAALEEKKKATAASSKRNKKRTRRQESQDSEEEESLCQLCGANFYAQNKHKQTKWAGCDSCDNWICVECLPDNFNYNEVFKCNEC